MVWACFSSKGVGRIVLIDGIMDKFQYARIIEENVRQSARELGLSRKKWIFQQDNGNGKVINFKNFSLVIYCNF